MVTLWSGKLFVVSFWSSVLSLTVVFGLCFETKMYCRPAWISCCTLCFLKCPKADDRQNFLFFPFPHDAVLNVAAQLFYFPR